jgi:hypothetical protein
MQTSISDLGLHMTGTSYVSHGSILTHLNIFICDTKLMASCAVEIEEVL